MRAVFVGGGTGGHVNPALSIAGYLKKREPDAEILYIGAKGGIEERLVTAAGYELKTITITGFQRKLTPQNLVRNIKTVKNLFSASTEAKRILQDFKPDVCIGTGGYVSGPVIREAAKLKIPALIHESNAFPGKTTKWVSSYVYAVLLAVEDAKKYFDKKVNTVVTGNPVRSEILDADPGKSREKLKLDSRPVILSFGGSLGARAINSAVIEMLTESAKEKKYQHIHGYGTHDEDFFERLERAGFNGEDNGQIRLLPYIDDMPSYLAAADLVISRSGAMTLTEIEAKGRASILIPSPNVAENHQYYNAKALADKNAAKMIEEKDLTGEALWELADSLMGNLLKLRRLADNALKMQNFDANSRIYREIKRAVKAGENKDKS